MSRLKWAYGVTTVPMRRHDLLPRTLKSLAAGGFDQPRLFVDDCTNTEAAEYERQFGLEVTARYPCIRTFGNWVLTLAELYIRNPWADRYFVAQDDFVTYRNLRAYLERCAYPEQGYWNLYTFPSNQVLAPADGLPGWYRSNQNGRGAVALVFSRPAVMLLLAHAHMIERPQDAHRGHRSVDGGIVEAFRKVGWEEWVHNPSLVQHTGLVSAMRNKPHQLSPSFRDEEFDALSLIAERTPTPLGASAYDAFPAPARQLLADGWRQELLAVTRAIEGDRERLARAPDKQAQRHFMRLIREYEEKLRRLEINNPPYICDQALCGTLETAPAPLSS